MLLIIFLLYIITISSYNIYFFKGSFINNHIYKNFLVKLKEELPDSIIKETPYIICNKIEDNVIVIGHSFGGFVSLLYAMKYSEQIKGCILLNSHFNENYKMPYLSVKLKDITQPVLCICGKNDRRLPYTAVEDDMNIAKQEKKARKQFIFHNGDHFSTFVNAKNRLNAVYRIKKFLHN